MAKRKIALHLKKYNYQELYTFGKKIHDGFVRLVADYPSPSPSMAAFDASLALLKQNIGDWGNGAGSKSQHEQLRLARDTVRDSLWSLARYAMVTKKDDFQSWLELGFELQKLPSKTGRMQAVTNFRHMIERNIPYGMLSLKWGRPLETSPYLYLAYELYRAEVPEFSKSVFIGSTQNKASFMDTPPKVGVVYYYWVIAVTAAGDGVPSEMCSAFASPI